SAQPSVFGTTFLSHRRRKGSAHHSLTRFQKTADQTTGGFFLPHLGITVDISMFHPVAKLTNEYPR
ncbi:MAG: hypothetical protein ACK5O6_03015, partial [Betaproteobacteria bacterium]